MTTVQPSFDVMRSLSIDAIEREIDLNNLSLPMASVLDANPLPMFQTASLGSLSGLERYIIVSLFSPRHLLFSVSDFALSHVLCLPSSEITRITFTGTFSDDFDFCGCVHVLCTLFDSGH